MRNVYLFEASRFERDGEVFILGRVDGIDCILTFFDNGAKPGKRSLLKGEIGGVPGFGSVDLQVNPATYGNMLAFEREVAPERRLIPLHGAGYRQTMGMGNRVVVSWKDGAVVRDPGCLAGFEGSYRSTEGTGVPAWFIQQSIARELLPEGIRAEDHPGIGHTGGYGPRELLRAGLFAYAALGGYKSGALPIGADADHAIIVGHDEASLAASLAHNKLAMAEAREYTKFTVDTSQLFGFPHVLSDGERKQLLDAFRGRQFDVPNSIPGQPGFTYRFSDDEVVALGEKYLRACQIHRELYDYCVSMKGSVPFDYELSLDETPAPAPANELLFYLTVLEEVCGLPSNKVSAAGPNIGYFKRNDYKGDIYSELYPLTNACSSILAQRGIAFSVHSGDGASPFSGRGPGVDITVGRATNRWMELKLSDIYQEMLWHAMAYSDYPDEAALFGEVWEETRRAVAVMSRAYEDLVVGKSAAESAALLDDPARIEAIGAAVGNREAAVGLIKGVLNYGVTQLKYANHFLKYADTENRRPTDEFFRRFVQYVFPKVRGPIYQTLRPETWDAYDAMCRRYTHMRMSDLGFIR